MSAADVKAREAMQEAILTAWEAMGRDGSQTLSSLAADVALAAIAAEREAAAKVCDEIAAKYGAAYAKAKDWEKPEMHEPSMRDVGEDCAAAIRARCGAAASREPMGPGERGAS